MALTEEQQRVYEWLNDISMPVFAEAYRGAVAFIDEKPAGYISFVSHAGRDLMNSLATEISGIRTRSGRVDYQWHVNGLQIVWQDKWSDDVSQERGESGHLIPIDVCEKISSLIENHRAGQDRDKDKAALFFSEFLEYSDRDKIPKNFLAEWGSAKRWFQGHAHLRAKPFRPEIADELEEHFKCLDGYLYIAASSQYDRLKDLNEILDLTNR